MLSPDEFTVGLFATARPLSLILPRGGREQAAIIGAYDDAPTAVFLSGEYRFRSFRSDTNTTWSGLIVPDVRVEVDETSVFDPDCDGFGAGAVIRFGARLVMYSVPDPNSAQRLATVLHDNLPGTAQLRAAFLRWHVVIGTGRDKRTLWRAPEQSAEEN
ncbi:MAG: hypothetical protein ACREEB_18540 [Caulobacteraceae bacterium]